MTTRSRVATAVLALAMAAPGYSATAGDGDLTFAVLGDMPYNAAQEITATKVLAPILADSGLPFLIHLGDFKAGNESCTDDLFAKRHDEIYGLLPGRVFYTPGDNEWTDCDRDGLASPRPEVERLDRLRAIFYPAPLSVPGAWAVAAQDGYPENAIWTVDEVVFATIHVVGTNNGRNKIRAIDADGKPLSGSQAQAYVAQALGRVAARDAANASWLETTFARATEIGARAVVIATQADITDSGFYARCEERTQADCDGFHDLRAKLAKRAGQFGKPVLLIHGDTHAYCLDKKFGRITAPNLWRLNALGDFTDVDATLVTVGGPGADQAFAVNRLMTGGFLARDANCK